MSATQFGWVVQPTPRKAETTSGLFTDNKKFLNALKGQFSSAWMEDHFQWNDRATLECWTALTYLAAEYPEFAWGTIVLGQAYRNPALVAKMAATLQFISGGRTILGIGAGWKEDEHLAYGWRMAPPRERIEQLEEAVQIIRALWRESPATFHGRYYSIDHAYCLPRPEPPIPLLLGTSGERAGLKLVAKYADWWNGAFMTVEQYGRKLQVLRRFCDEVGRDETAIVKTLYAFVSLSEVPERLAPRRDDGLYVMSGSADAITAEFQRFISLGAQHILIRFMDFPGTEGLELFLGSVLPRLR